MSESVVISFPIVGRIPSAGICKMLNRPSLRLDCCLLETNGTRKEGLKALLMYHVSSGKTCLEGQTSDGSAIAADR